MSWERIKDLVHQALQIPAGERARFLDEAYGSDAAIRAEVEAGKDGYELIRSLRAKGLGSDVGVYLCNRVERESSTICRLERSLLSDRIDVDPQLKARSYCSPLRLAFL